jgi:hypothetical protein
MLLEEITMQNLPLRIEEREESIPDWCINTEYVILDSRSYKIAVFYEKDLAEGFINFVNAFAK